MAKPAETIRLGADLAAGERPQAIVPAGAWQSAESLGDWTLVGCTVAPGFRFEGFELAPPDWEPDPSRSHRARIETCPSATRSPDSALLCIGLLPLSACVYSHHDLADELRPEFPLAEGAYLDEKGAELHVEKVDQLYRVTDPDDEIYEIAFFRIPDYAGYVVRLNPERVGTSQHENPKVFAYGFARQAGGAMTFYVVEKDAVLPPELTPLVVRDPSDDSGFGVRDEKDAVLVLGIVANHVQLKHSDDAHAETVSDAVAYRSSFCVEYVRRGHRRSSGSPPRRRGRSAPGCRGRTSGSRCPRGRHRSRCSWRSR